MLFASGRAACRLPACRRLLGCSSVVHAAQLTGVRDSAAGGGDLRGRLWEEEERTPRMTPKDGQMRAQAEADTQQFVHNFFERLDFER